MGAAILRHRSATKTDVKAVMKNLSEVSKSELSHAELSPEIAKKMMLDAMKASEAIAFLERAEVMAVLIFNQVAQNEFSTMFMATEKFFGQRGRPSLYLRRYLDGRFASNPKLVLTSETYSDHPELHRWYKLMNYDPGVKEGARTRFIRRARSVEI